MMSRMFTFLSVFSTSSRHLKRNSILSAHALIYDKVGHQNKKGSDEFIFCCKSEYQFSCLKPFKILSLKVWSVKNARNVTLYLCFETNPNKDNAARLFISAQCSTFCGFIWLWYCFAVKLRCCCSAAHFKEFADCISTSHESPNFFCGKVNLDKNF